MPSRKKTSRPTGMLANPLDAYESSYDLVANVGEAIVLFSGSHTDHGLLDEHWNFVEQLAKTHVQQHGVVPMIGTYEMPSEIEPLPNALYGPASGDRPVPEEGVFYASRGGRPWKDRLILAPKRDSHLITVIAVPEFRADAPKDRLVAFTAYGGPMAPQNPEDSSNKNPAAARKFWAEHALAVDEVPSS